MRALARRVLDSTVSVEQEIVGKINKGLLVYVGVHQQDELVDLEWMVKKILGMRVFENKENKMDLSLLDLNYDLLVVSQFTLFGTLKKGFRPSFNLAAHPSFAQEQYLHFIEKIKKNYDGRVEVGKFGADMTIDSTDDGPVSLWLDSKEKNY